MHEQTIFTEAMEIEDGARRAAFLDRACGGDLALRERVEKLLQRHQQDDSFLESPAVAPAVTGEYTPDPAGKQAATGPMEQPGTVIGPYKLLQAIGEGGMGTVFMAEQTRPVQRMVALKIIKPGMDSRQVIARFEAERQALALMDHPNIAKVLDGGTTETGRPYFVMELVKGVPITRFCDERRLTPKQRLELFIPVCQAVQHAHQKGIIHRDLKPSNVLIALYDDKPVPKVIDFGIAKATGQKLTERTMFTEFGQVVGTLEYMSPEQAGLNQLDIDTRSDIYSLGVILYELLTGSTPLEKKRLKEGAMLEVLRLVREEEPPKPSTRLSTTDEMPSIAANRGLEPKKLSGLVRGDLDWIVMKCLEKDRNRRYETANGLAVEIQRYLADEPVQACPPSAWYRLRKFSRRHKAGLLTTAAVLLIALLGAGGIGWALWDRAEQQEATRLEHAERSAETERAVSVALAKAEQLGEQAQKMPSATSAEAAAVLVVWRQAEDTQTQAAVAMKTGKADDSLSQRVAAVREQLERGRRLAERAWAQALRKEKLLRDLDEARMARLVWVDPHFDHAGAAAKYAAAFAEYDLDVMPDRTDELARRLGAEEPDVRDAICLALDDWADAAGQARTAWSTTDLRALAQATDNNPWRKRFRAAITAKDREALRNLSAEARQSSVPPSSLVLLAGHLFARGERGEALAMLRWGQGRHPADFWVHFQLGGFLGGEGLAPEEVEEQIGCYRTALALRPAASAAHNNLGSALRAKNQLDEAIAEFRMAIEINPKLERAYTNLGLALHAKNELDDAIAEYRKAIDLFPKNADLHTILGNALKAKNQVDEAIAEHRKAIELDPNLERAYANLGNTLKAKNQVHEAIAEFRKAIDLFPKNADLHDNLGLALEAKNQVDEAFAEFRKAIDLDPKFANPHNNLGLALRDKNQLDEAIAEFRKAIKLDPKFAMAHTNLGNALQDKNQLDDAIAEHRKAIAFDPKLAKAHSNLGNALRDKNQLDEAIAACRKAIELDPKLASAHNNLGAALKAKNQVDEAIAEYHKAIELDPKYAEPHSNLGIALKTKNQLDAAIAEHRKAVALNSKLAGAHYNLGCCLHDKNQLDEAIIEYRTAIELDPKFALAHTNLGNALKAKNQLDDAIAEHRKAIHLDPQNAIAHHNLGNALWAKNELDEAIAEYRKASGLDPKFALAHGALGQVLMLKGRFAEAKTSTQQALKMLPEKHPWRPIGLRLLQQCKNLLALEAKLLDVLAGKAQPTDNRERLGLISVCQLQKRHAVAVRFYSEAFAADVKLADSLIVAHRYDAACAAALASVGQGADAEKLDDTEKARLRKKAIDWLRADFVARVRLLEKNPLQAVKIEEDLQRWQRAAELFSLRDASARAKHPAAEQAALKLLWSEVESLEKRARSSYTLTDLKGQLDPKERNQSHRIKMTAGKTYVIDMQSKAFDTLLKLEDSQGRLLAENDDISPTNLNSRIVFMPKQDDTYRIIATSYLQQGQGPYVIIIREFAGK